MDVIDREAARKAFCDNCEKPFHINGECMMGKHCNIMQVLDKILSVEVDKCTK